MRRSLLALVALTCSLGAQAQSAGAVQLSARTQAGGADSVRAVLPALTGRWLLTAEEAQAYGGEAGYNAPPPLRPRAAAPLIEILRPSPAPDLKVKAPFAINVEFKAQADAPIAPATFKVLYGALKLDITSRITRFVTVTPGGFALDNAQIPAGKHRITLQVQDEKQRVAERELRFEVE